MNKNSHNVALASGLIRRCVELSEYDAESLLKDIDYAREERIAERNKAVIEPSADNLPDTTD